jgi:Methyl coenzyme M reductase, beta subunit
MAKFSDTIDLYDDQGKLLKSGVALDKISPLTNPGIKKMISLTKRTVAVNLGGAEAFLKTGKAGKNQIPGRGLNLDLVANAGAIKERCSRCSRSPRVTTPRSRNSAAANFCFVRSHPLVLMQQQPTMQQ